MPYSIILISIFFSLSFVTIYYMLIYMTYSIVNLLFLTQHQKGKKEKNIYKKKLPNVSNIIVNKILENLEYCEAYLAQLVER